MLALKSITLARHQAAQCPNTKHRSFLARYEGVEALSGDEGALADLACLDAALTYQFIEFRSANTNRMAGFSNCESQLGCVVRLHDYNPARPKAGVPGRCGTRSYAETASREGGLIRAPFRHAEMRQEYGILLGAPAEQDLQHIVVAFRWCGGQRLNCTNLDLLHRQTFTGRSKFTRVVKYAALNRTEALRPKLVEFT